MDEVDKEVYDLLKFKRNFFSDVFFHNNNNNNNNSKKTSGWIVRRQTKGLYMTEVSGVWTFGGCWSPCKAAY